MTARTGFCFSATFLINNILVPEVCWRLIFPNSIHRNILPWKRSKKWWLRYSPALVNSADARNPSGIIAWAYDSSFSSYRCNLTESFMEKWFLQLLRDRPNVLTPEQILYVLCEPRKSLDRRLMAVDGRTTEVIKLFSTLCCVCDAVIEVCVDAIEERPQFGNPYLLIRCFTWLGWE